MAERRRKNDGSWVPATGTMLDDRYRLGGMLDRGGMGVIMRGEHVVMGREVAVKLLNPAFSADASYRARFRREVNVASSLEHPNIVRCYDFGETDDGILYLVMEMLSGCSLDKLLRDTGPLDLRRAARIAAQMLDGLAVAHLHGVVHRDLKPANLFVTVDVRGQEVVKLLDFGLAKPVSSDDARITATGSILGTAAYLPPEVLLTQQNTMAGDVYACGLIMLELVLGRRVFSAWSTTQTFLQQLTLPARIPRRIYETAYGRLVAQCLQKHPDDRPANADVAFQALSGALGALPDVMLSDDERPPAFTKELMDSMISDFRQGRISTLDALRLLPTPEPFDTDEIPIDELETQKIVLADLDAYAARQAELKPTIQMDGPPDMMPLPEEESIVEAPPRSFAGVAILLAVLVVLAAVAVAVVREEPPTPPPEEPPRVVVAPHESPTPPPEVEPVAVAVDLGGAPDVAMVAVEDAGASVAAAEPVPEPEQPRKTRPKPRPKPKPKPKVEPVPAAEPEEETSKDAILEKYLKVGKP